MLQCKPNQVVYAKSGYGQENLELSNMDGIWMDDPKDFGTSDALEHSDVLNPPA